jgi:hypothetical protein
MRIRTFLQLLSLLSAARGSREADSVQRVAMPDRAGGIEDASWSRVRCLREAALHGKRMPALIHDGELEVGGTWQGGFSC